LDYCSNTILKHSGRQRENQEAIASIVRSLPKGTHLTAPEVFERARAVGLDVSLSTVYRNLHRLRADGNVMTVGGDRGLRYETAEEVQEHDHLICLECGLTIEFSDELIRGFGKTVAERKGFEHRSSRFDILGHCADCNAKDEAHRIEQSREMFQAVLVNLAQVTASIKQALELNDARKFSKSLKVGEESLTKMNEAISACQTAISLLPRQSTIHDA
jgi:Fur family transcriptional regulator, ferric uptake regulator